jgi:uncharacterized protein YutE (UPF0331/DUF86 family)
MRPFCAWGNWGCCPGLRPTSGALAGFRNILVHEYLEVDWQEVYRNLQQLEDLARFAEAVRGWLKKQS